MNEEDFQILAQLKESYKLAQCVCDPIEYNHRQKLLLQAVALAVIHILEPREDAID